MSNVLKKYTELKPVELPAGEVVFARPIRFLDYVRLHDLKSESDEEKYAFNNEFIAAMIVDGNGEPLLTADDAGKLDTNVYATLLTACHEHAQIGRIEEKKSGSGKTKP